MEWLTSQTLIRLIESLDDTRFVDLGNALLSETAARNDIDRTCLATNLNTKEPDGGIDAHYAGASKTVGRLLPRLLSDYQFKGGRQKKSARQIVEQDILSKPRVLEGLRNGHAFVYVAAWDRGDEFETDLIATLRGEISRQQGNGQVDGLTIEDGQIVFIGVDVIARLLITFPGLAARFVKIDVPLLDLEQWSAIKALSNPYQADTNLEARIKALQTQIESSSSRTRLVGAAGHGKTRMVLEALRSSSLADSVVYAPQRADVTPAFVAHLARTQDIRCTLVVDEVDDATVADLENRFSAMPPGVRLITLGLDSSRRSRPETFQVEGLNEDLLIAAILAIVPNLPPEIARSIARECEQSPKLAVLLASRIREEPSLVAPVQWLADGVVWGALDRYLSIPFDSPAWNALSVTALPIGVGWLDEIESESETLFRAVGLDPVAARRYVDQLHERFGIAPLAGSYRYISPAILADHLAAKQLEAWPRARIIEFFNALTPPMADRFAQRVRRMAGVLRNGRAIEEVVLGDQGPFRTLADLEGSKIGAILRRFAAPFPRATLAALRRIIEPASLEELQAATGSRRDLVWALEEVLWREDTFEGAAALLLRLAIAENETWSNNATRIWVETFQMMLGRTAAGPERRARVLRRVAGGVEPARRRLAAEAIGVGLRIGQFHRGVMPPEELEGGPVEDWRPATYGEWSEAIIDFLAILDPLLSDPDTSVRLAAARALGEGVEAALRLPRVSEIWARMARTLVEADFAVRTPILEAVDRAQMIWELRTTDSAPDGREVTESERKSDELRQERLATLVAAANDVRGQDFSSRFRDALTRSPRLAMEATVRGDAEKDALRRLDRLATEVIAQPALLRDEADWLLTGDPMRAVEWFGVLGQYDQERIIEPLLREWVSRAPSSILWASLYDLAYARAINDPDFVDSRIRELAAMGAPAAQIFDLVMRSGYSPTRLSKVIELIQSGALPPVAATQLAYRPWGPAMPTVAARELAEIAFERATDPSEVLRFVVDYLTQVEEAASEFRDFALKILATVPTNQASRVRTDEWAWTRLARIFVDEAPGQITSAALAQLSASGPGWSDEVRKVLARAWEVGDKARLFEEVIAPWIEEEELGGWLIRTTLVGFPVADVGVGVLMTWVATAPSQRAPALAQLIGPPGDEVSAIHAALLEKYDDEGIGSTFYAALLTGSWTGSVSGWYRGKLDRARRWLADERPWVRAWAQDTVRSLEKEIRSAEETEAEERFRP